MTKDEEIRMINEKLDFYVITHRGYFLGFRLLPDAWKLIPD